MLETYDIFHYLTTHILRKNPSTHFLSIGKILRGFSARLTLFLPFCLSRGTAFSPGKQDNGDQ